jgi:hypothetical protein
LIPIANVIEVNAMKPIREDDSFIHYLFLFLLSISAVIFVRCEMTVEPLHYVSRAAPAALLFQNGRTDVAVPAPDAIRYQLEGSQPIDIIWYNGGHNMTSQAFTDQENWLSRYISFQ